MLGSKENIIGNAYQNYLCFSQVSVFEFKASRNLSVTQVQIADCYFYLDVKTILLENAVKYTGKLVTLYCTLL